MPSEFDKPDREHDEWVATLLRTAGRRAAPPRAAYEATLAVATAALEREVAARRRRAWLPLAASLGAIAITGLWLAGRTPENDPGIAAVDRVIGTAAIAGAGGTDWSPLVQRRALPAGARIRTERGGRLGLTLAGGESLRIAESTEVALVSRSEIDLLTGKIYLDTDGAPEGAAIAVRTLTGVTRDIGTRFEVRYADGAYRLRVRSGKVVLERERDRILGETGEEISLDPRGEVSRTHIAPDARDWQWTFDVGPDRELDGEPLVDLLDWVERETGTSIRFATAEIESRANTTILHGRIRGLDALEALSVMLATTDLEHTVLEDGTILIRARSNETR
jgi:ferric-dicitrate binding protein FerR (iron transport regulator)